MSCTKKYEYIYWLAIINSVLLIVVFGPRIYSDTESYLRAWEDYISNGKIDILRTPIYPLFLGLCKIIAGSHYQFLAICLQHGVLIVSIYYFKGILMLLIRSHKVIWWITLIYALCPTITTWANALLTESLAISGCVFLFYLMIKAYTSDKKSLIVYVTLGLAVLIMLRPAFIYMAPVCLIEWLLLIKSKPRYAYHGIVGIIVAGLLYLGYCAMYKERYGLFTTSSVNTINQSYLAFEKGLMHPDYTEEVAYKDFILNYNEDDYGDLWNVTSLIINQYGLATVQKSVEASYRSQPLEWIKSIFGRAYQASQMLLPPAIPTIATAVDIFGFNIGNIYCLMLIHLLIHLYWYFKYKTFHPISFLLWLAVSANMLTIIIGAQNEWGRLILPSAPLILIILGQASNHIYPKTS